MAIKFSVEEPVQVQTVTPPEQIAPSIRFSVEEPVEDTPAKPTLWRDFKTSIAEIPRNLEVGSISTAASMAEAVKKRTMQLSGAGIFPDQTLKSQYEVLKPEANPQDTTGIQPGSVIGQAMGQNTSSMMARNLDPRNRELPLLGSTAAQAMGTVSRLPDIVGKVLRDVADKETAKLTPDSGKLTNTARLVWQNIPGMAASIGASLLTGDPAVGLTMLGESEGGQAFQSHLDSGSSIVKSAIYGDLSEAAEIGGEMLVFPKFIKGFKKAVPLQEAFKIIAENAGQEGVTGFTQQFLDTFGKETTKGTSKLEAAKLAFKEGVKAIPENALVGGLTAGMIEATTGTLHGIGTGLEKLKFAGSASQQSKSSPPPVAGATGTPGTPAISTPPPIEAGDIKGLDDLKKEIESDSKATPEQKKFAGLMIGDIQTQIVTQLVEKHAEPITDVDSATKLFSNLVKELGATGFDGYKVVFHRNKKHVPGVKSYAVHFGSRKTIEFAIDSSYLMAETGQLWISPGKWLPIPNKTPGKVNQDLIKQVMIHEIGHNVKKPYRGPSGKRVVHHAAFTKWVQDSIKTAFTPTETKIKAPIVNTMRPGQVAEPTEQSPSMDSLSEKYKKGELLFAGVVHPSINTTYASNMPNMAAHFAEQKQAIGGQNPGKSGEGVVRVYEAKDGKYRTQNEYEISKDAKPIAIITSQEARNLLQTEQTPSMDKASPKKPRLGKVTPPANKATNEQKMRVHILARNLGYTNDQRKEIQKKLTGKDTMRGMSVAEAKIIDDFFTREAETRGLLTATAEELTNRLLDVHNPKPDEPWMLQRTRRTFRKLAHNIKIIAHNFIDRQWHIDRLIEQLDGLTHGIIYNSLWKKTREGSLNAVEAKEQRIQRFKNAGESLFGSAKAFYDFLTGGDIDMGHGIKKTAVERLGMLLYSKNEDSRFHLINGNFKGMPNPEATLAEILRSATPQEVALADWIMKDMEENYDRVNQAAILALGREINKEDNYFSMYLENIDIEQQTDFLTELLDQPNFAAGVVRTPGETIARRKGARQPLKLDAIQNYLHHIDRIEQFIHMGPIAKQIGAILNNKKFKATLNKITSGTGTDILTKWLKEVTVGFSAEGMTWMAKGMLFLRKSGVYYAMAYKIPSVARQFLSSFTAAAVHPSIAARIALNFSQEVIPGFYKKAEKLAFEKSIMLRNRSMERISDYISTSLSPAQRLQYKKSYSNSAMSWLRWADRHTAVLSWVALYDSAMNSPATQKQFGLDGTEKSAVAFADEWIEKTQSMGNTLYLADFFRGGPVEKLLTTFQNEDNAKWNFWMNDIVLSSKYGKIPKRLAMYRILMSYVAPALIFGMLGRGGPPDSWEDVVFDEAVYLLGPFFLFGRIIYNAIQGFSGGQTGPESIGFVEAGKAIEAAIKGKGGKAALHGVKAVGALSGRIPSQAITTGTGAYDIATGETKDLRRLIWTDWSLQNYGNIVGGSDSSDSPNQVRYKR